MRYEVQYPKAPEGPVFEADGTKWVPSDRWEGEWHRDYETSCDGLSWEEVVAEHGPFTDTRPTPEAWKDVHKGGLYWVEATRQGDEGTFRALAYATAPNTLIAMAPNRPISITPTLDNWELIDAEPMVAVSVSHILGLLSRCPGDYRQVVEDRLNRYGQVNWKLLDLSRFNG